MKLVEKVFLMLVMMGFGALPVQMRAMERDLRSIKEKEIAVWAEALRAYRLVSARSNLWDAVKQCCPWHRSIVLRDDNSERMSDYIISQVTSALDDGAHINEIYYDHRDNTADTPLLYAMCHDSKVASFLLDRGAMVDVKVAINKPYFAVALRDDIKPIVKNALEEAISSQTGEQISLLLQEILPTAIAALVVDYWKESMTPEEIARITVLIKELEEKPVEACFAEVFPAAAVLRSLTRAQKAERRYLERMERARSNREKDRI